MAAGILWLLPAVLLAGCAFDVSSVKTIPATFVAWPGCAVPWTLQKAETVSLGTGFPTRLREGTRWHCVGTLDAGTVFGTDDQVVTVEASNIYEAMAVIGDDLLVGFYLPVEKTLAPLSTPLKLQRKEDPP